MWNKMDLNCPNKYLCGKSDISFSREGKNSLSYFFFGGRIVGKNSSVVLMVALRIHILSSG